MPESKDDRQPNADAPVVTVVIPAYNAAACIDETLCALESQSIKSIEIICVDDGSTDATFSIIKRHQANDGRVKAIHQENSGAGVARNTGAAKAKGAWLAFLDADDIYRPNFLETMVDAAVDGGAEIAVCEFDSFHDGTGEIKPYFRVAPNIAGPVVATSDYSSILFQMVTAGPFNKIYKTSYIRDSGLQYQALHNCNDAFFTFAALAGAHRVAIVRKSLVSYRVAEGTSIQDDLVKSPTMEKCLCVYRAMSALRSYCLEHNYLNELSARSLDSLTIKNSYASIAKAIGHEELLRDVFDYYQDAFINTWRIPKPLKATGFEICSKYDLISRGNADQFAWVYKEAGKSRSGGFTRKALLGAKTAIVIARNKLRGKK